MTLMLAYLEKIIPEMAQPVLFGLQPNYATVAWTVDLRLDLNTDNPLFEVHSQVIGHALRGHFLGKAFWTLVETNAKGRKNENRFVVEKIKLALGLGSRES